MANTIGYWVLGGFLGIVLTLHIFKKSGGTFLSKRQTPTPRSSARDATILTHLQLHLGEVLISESLAISHIQRSRSVGLYIIFKEKTHTKLIKNVIKDDKMFIEYL